MRSDAPRTAYSGYPLPHQPASEVPTVCHVSPRAQPVTRDSRNRAHRRRNMKRVRSPYMSHLEEERPNLHIKCGNTRTASRTPKTYTIFPLGFMNQHAGPADSIIPASGPCTGSSAVISTDSTEVDTVTSSSSTSPGPSPSSSLTSPEPSPPSSPTPIDITNAIGRIDDTLDARVRDEPYMFDAQVSDEISALTELTEFRQETASNMTPSGLSPSSWTSMSPGWSPTTLPSTSPGENTIFSALISENQLQPPADMPDFTACIVDGEDGPKVYDPLRFLPTSTVRFKGKHSGPVLLATTSAAAAIDLQQPDAGTKVQLDLHSVSSVPPAQQSAAHHSTAQYRTAQQSAAHHSTAQYRTAQPHTPVQHSAPLHTTVPHNAPLHSTAQRNTAPLSTAHPSALLHHTAPLSTAPLSTAQHSAPLHSTAPLSTAQHNTAPLSTAHPSAPLHSTAPLSTTPLSTAQHNAPRHSTAPLSTAQLSTAQLSAPQHRTAPHRATQSSADQHKTAPGSTLTLSTITGSAGSVKTGIEELFNRQLAGFGHKGDETQSFRRPWKSARIKGPSSVSSVPVILSHFVSTHAHTSEKAPKRTRHTAHHCTHLHGTLHDTLHNTLPGTRTARRSSWRYYSSL